MQEYGQSGAEGMPGAPYGVDQTSYDQTQQGYQGGYQGYDYGQVPPVGMQSGSAMMPGAMPGQVPMPYRKSKDPYALKDPKHGQSSTWIIICGILGFLMLLLAVVIPNWKANYMGLPLYPFRRTWGLFTVMGRTNQFHHQQMSKACDYGTLKVGNLCTSPICRWYLLKCQVYYEMTITSYCIGVLFLIPIFVHGLCLYWTFSLTRRSIRWAARWWFLLFLGQLTLFITWHVMLDTLFEQLNEKAMYPSPYLGVGSIALLISSTSQFICAFLGHILKDMWPEEEDDDSDRSSSSDDSEDDEKAKAEKKHAQGPPLPPFGAYDMAQPPQAWDYSQQPAYDPNAAQYGAPEAQYGAPEVEYAAPEVQYDTVAPETQNGQYGAPEQSEPLNEVLFRSPTKVEAPYAK